MYGMFGRFILKFGKGYVEEAECSSRIIRFSLSLYLISQFFVLFNTICLCYWTYESVSKPFPFFLFLVPYSFISKYSYRCIFPINWTKCTQLFCLFQFIYFFTVFQNEKFIFFISINSVALSKFKFIKEKNSMYNYELYALRTQNRLSYNAKTNAHESQEYGFKNALRSIVECWTQLKTVYPYVVPYKYIHMYSVLGTTIYAQCVGISDSAIPIGACVKNSVCEIPRNAYFDEAAKVLVVTKTNKQP